MANNNIDQRIRYRKGSSKPEQPKHEKLNGNVISIFPIPHERPWHEDVPKTEDNGDDRTERDLQEQYEDYQQMNQEIPIDKPELNYEQWLKLYDKRFAERSTPPPPYGTETFGWQEYDDYRDKLRPGAIPLSFPKFMDQLDMRPEDYFGKLRRKRREDEGVMKVVAEPSSWQRKYLEHFGFDRKYLDNLKRDYLERLFDDIMTRRALRGRA